MNKTWGEIKREIINLGFEDEETFETKREVFFEGVNRALNILALGVTPIVKTLTIKKDEFLQSYIFNIKEKDGAFYDFISPVCTKAEDFSHISARVLPDKRLYCRGEEDITVWYKCQPKEIGSATLDNEEITLPKEGALLLPLLACFYIWQEDDERKAITYRNDYEALKAQLIKDYRKAYVIEGAVI